MEYKGSSKILKALVEAVNSVDTTLSGKVDALAKEINECKMALSKKQDLLSFDEKPTTGSENPVKSNGIADAISKIISVRTVLWDGNVVAPVDMTTIGLRDSLDKYDAIGFYVTFTSDKFGGYAEVPVSIVRAHQSQIIASSIFQNYALTVQYDTESRIKIGSSDTAAIVTFKQIYGIKYR